jgi:hypothetical protein
MMEVQHKMRQEKPGQYHGESQKYRAILEDVSVFTASVADASVAVTIVVVIA